MESFGFLFDGTRCTGCKTCMMACKDYHALPSPISFRQVYEYELDGGWRKDEAGCWTLEEGAGTYYVSLACNHCDDPACMQACPTGAMHREEGGIVCVDEGRCIGCGYCALSCPYHAPKVDSAVGHSVKCDACRARLAKGKPPICVAACPQRALDAGEVSELFERWPDITSAVAPLPSGSLTGPRLAIRPCRAMVEPGSGRGRVANRGEIV